ncbi:MAG: AAA family ATPase [Alphaproteobacteria bacterium GM202ARS2]|nr:AAA family ATPase [Alphaproteobacteria bacterium GM202ARS2]
MTTFTPPVVYGQRSCETDFRRACDSQQRHHSWLLYGPRGLGKTALAYKMAAFVLQTSPASPAPPDTLPELDPTQPTIKRILAGSHHHFLAVTPTVGKGAKTASISIESIRQIHDFLNLTALQGHTKVVVIDPFDAVVPAGGHALLKIIEEPPPHSLFILTAHSINTVPPTIRSRCRLQRLVPLSFDDFSTFLKTQDLPTTINEQELYQLSGGVPGRALLWLNQQEETFVVPLQNILKNLTNSMPIPHDPLLRLATIIDKDARADTSQNLWLLFWDRIFHWLHQHITTTPIHFHHPIFATWSRLLALYQRSERLYLARGQTVISVFFHIHHALAQGHNQKT